MTKPEVERLLKLATVGANVGWDTVKDLELVAKFRALLIPAETP